MNTPSLTVPGAAGADAAIGRIAPVHLANPNTLYADRAARLRALAGRGDVPGDYLLFAARLVDAQNAVCKQRSPGFPSTALNIDWTTLPLTSAMLLHNGRWQQDLQALLAVLRGQPDNNDALRRVFDRLEGMSAAESEAAAKALFDGDVTRIGSDGAPFLWAAVSLNAMLLAARGNVTVHEASDADRSLCPMCGSTPVASIVHTDGLRYLHCRLCETEWHLVRALCSQCNAGRDIGYWTLDSGEASNETSSRKEGKALCKAESCGDCHSYLKILFRDQDKAMDVVADDLATLALDLRMEEEGFMKSGANPFLFSLAPAAA